MNIRFVTSNTFPDGQAATSRVRCYAKALLAHGCKVEVVAPFNRKRLTGSQWLFSGVHESIPFQVVDNRNTPKTRLGVAFRSYLSLYLMLIHTICTGRQSDVYFLYNNSVLSRFLLLIFLRLIGKKVVLELNEYPFSPDGSRITQLPGIRSILRFFVFKLVFPLADGIVVISKELELVAAKYAPKAKLLKVPILTDSVCSHEINVTSKKDSYLFHAGSLSEQKDGILPVFEAFAIAHRAIRGKNGIHLKFVVTNFIAFPETKQGIDNILKKYDLRDSLIVTGFLREPELQVYMREAIGFVVNKPHNFQNRYNFPTKLASYMLSGRPVILAARNIEANEYLKNEENSIVVDPDDIQGMATAIERVVLDADLSSSLGRRGTESAYKNFYYEHHGARLFNYLKSL
jgi:glycosyltransferase involved in cell wall biosynthesis